MSADRFQKLTVIVGQQDARSGKGCDVQGETVWISLPPGVPLGASPTILSLMSAATTSDLRAPARRGP
jgi:hypothetical protein